MFLLLGLGCNQPEQKGHEEESLSVEHMPCAHVRQLHPDAFSSSSSSSSSFRRGRLRLLVSMALPAFLLPRTTCSSFLYNPLRSKPLSRQLASNFPGQKLRISTGFTKYTFRAPYFHIRANLNKNNSNLSNDLIDSGEHFLDDISHWISKKIADNARPHLPENFDILDWLPSGLHSRIHSVERAAAVFVRECLILVFVSFIFTRVGGFCQWLSRVHYSRTHEGEEPSDSYYQLSVYGAMEGPLKAGLLLWQISHMLHVVGPSFKLKFGRIVVEKARLIGLIMVVTWFLFKWKHLVVQQVISQRKRDAAQFVAIDRVVSLLMLYIAGTCIGEVVGFALQSVLAVGGVFGIAVGLSAQKIVGNLLAGVLLFVVRPFVIGDRVKSKSFEGWVEDINFLHTRIRAYDHSPVLVPNGAIMNEVITNYSRAKCRRLVAGFTLRNEDIFLVDKITGEIKEYLTNHPSVDLVNGAKPFCYLKKMGPEGLEIELLCSIEEKGPETCYIATQEILVQAAKIVTSAGACFETNASVVLMRDEERVPAA